jgi:hypothetical protein
MRLSSKGEHSQKIPEPQSSGPAEKSFKLDSRCRLRRKSAHTSKVEVTVQGRSSQRRANRTETSMRVE